MAGRTKSRLVEFIDFKGLSKRKFCDSVGIAHTIFNNDSAIGSDKLELIFNGYPELNIDWTVTGRGEMLFKNKPQMIVGADTEPAEIAMEALKSQVAKYKDEMMSLKDELIICLKEKDAERKAREKLVEQFQQEKEQLIKDFTNTHLQKQMEK